MWVVVHYFVTGAYHVFSGDFWLRVSSIHPDDFMLLSIEYTYDAARHTQFEYINDLVCKELVGMIV